jgi:archaellum component FlaF (FlaF/FlaG flagellin family)
MRLLRRGLPAAFVMLAFAAPALAQGDPSFRINNRTNVVINEIYVSSANDTSWGRDQLGQNVLPPGQSYVIRLPQAQCINDIRVVFANGQAHERRRVDTCQITDYNME